MDVDLSCESTTAKISRRQAYMSLDASGEFRISNMGQRVVTVDGNQVRGVWMSLLMTCTVYEPRCEWQLKGSHTMPACWHGAAGADSGWQPGTQTMMKACIMPWHVALFQLKKKYLEEGVLPLVELNLGRLSTFYIGIR